MATVRKYILAGSVFFMGFLSSIRLMPALQYNAGHLALVSYVQRNEIDKQNDVKLLQRAEQSFLQVHNASLSNPRVNWRLSFLAFEQGRFDEATDFFLEAQETAPPDFLLTKQSNRFYTSHQYHQLNALASERQKYAMETLQAYRYALAIEPRELPIELYRRYYGVLAKLENLEMQAISQRLQDFRNGEESGDATAIFEHYMTPVLPVLTENESDECWELTQIRYDRLALETGPLLPVELSWQYIKEPSQMFTETLIVVNLAPNAGFEWGEQDGEPIGYPDTIYLEDNPLLNHRLFESDILSRTTYVAGLVNSAQHYNSSYASNAIPVDSDTLYFQGGWVKSDEGNAYIGHRWQGNLEGLERRHQYVTGGIRNSDWAFYGRILSIPAQIDKVNLWFLNFNSEGTAYFDDVLFFKIALPDCNLEEVP